jgi:hypothetical protein
MHYNLNNYSTEIENCQYTIYNLITRRCEYVGSIPRWLGDVKMNKLVMGTVIGLMLFVGGCTQATYVHDTKNAQDLERDKYKCRQIAQQSAAKMGESSNPFYMRDEIKRCLINKYGWRVRGHS